MQRTLSFEQGPPIAAPFRYFLSAPLLAAIAGLVAAFAGPDLLATRWSPALLAFTHLLTLGFAAMVMVGSLLQILPVVAGIAPPRAGWLAAGVHALLLAGTLLLAAGFVLGQAWPFRLAVPLLGMAFAWLAAAVLRATWGVADRGAMLPAVRLAVAALLVTAGLGVALGGAFGWQLALPMVALTDLHAAWGLAGWIGLLVVAVAFQVVPMFLVTPVYPASVTARLPRAVFALLFLLSLDAAWRIAGGSLPEWPASLVSALLAAALGLFALTTLLLLRRSKRAAVDATRLFWLVSMWSLLACAALWWLRLALPADSAVAERLGMLVGALFLLGFAWSVINGMLYKIVPFLVWYHLQAQLSGACGRAPNVKAILPDATARRQFRLHLAVLAAWIAAVAWPPLLPAAGILLAASALSLWWNLLGATRMYCRLLAADRASSA